MVSLELGKNRTEDAIGVETFHRLEEFTQRCWSRRLIIVNKPNQIADRHADGEISGETYVLLCLGVVVNIEATRFSELVDGVSRRIRVVVDDDDVDHYIRLEYLPLQAFEQVAKAFVSLIRRDAYCARGHAAGSLKALGRNVAAVHRAAEHTNTNDSKIDGKSDPRVAG